MSEIFNPALIIVDVQEDFLPPDGSLAVKDGREIIPKILELMDLSKFNWKLIIATKDWHPSDHTSFASYHNQEPYSTKVFSHPLKEIDPSTNEVMLKTQVLWPDHCVQHTKGSEITKEIQDKLEELEKKNEIPIKIVKKGYIQDREYYSCFQDTWGIHHTECGSILKENGITDVFTVGIAYDYCVLNSSIDSSKLGYTTFVVKDYCRAVDASANEQTEKCYKDNNVSIISSKDDIFQKLLK